MAGNQSVMHKTSYNHNPMKTILLFVASILFAMNTVAQKTGSVEIQFDNVVGNQDLVLKDKTYTNANGDEFAVSLFQYYVSNFRLTRKDGSEYVVPQDESYFLIREQRPETQRIVLKNIPKGTYVGVSFVIGVDSLRSASDVSRRQGCLDVGGEGKDMYWAWNSGYIFVKMEGRSPQVPMTGNRKDPVFMYHIGLFGGMGDKKTLNNIKAANLGFGTDKVRVKTDDITRIGIKTDASKLLNGSTNVSIAANPSVMGGPYSKHIADNYATMFSYDGLKKELPAGKGAGVVGMNE